MTAALRREFRRQSWLLAAVPLAGACASAAAFAVCMAVADRVLALDAFNDDEEAQI